MRVRQQVLVAFMALATLIGASTASAATTTARRSASARRTLTRRPVRRRRAETVTPAVTPGSGGAGMTSPSASLAPSAPSTPAHPIVPGSVAKIVNGVAYAPAAAPLAVQQAIWAGNAIRHKPYIYGGGHGTWNDSGYDCSGSVSYVLHAAGLIKTSMDSGQYETWGQSGAGQWITVYANGGHAFVQIAGIRLDTSAEQDPNPQTGSGPRWRVLMTSTAGYQARHPLGY